MPRRRRAARPHPGSASGTEFVRQRLYSAPAGRGSERRGQRHHRHLAAAHPAGRVRPRACGVQARAAPADLAKAKLGERESQRVIVFGRTRQKARRAVQANRECIAHARESRDSTRPRRHALRRCRVARAATASISTSAAASSSATRHHDPSRAFASRSHRQSRGAVRPRGSGPTRSPRDRRGVGHPLLAQQPRHGHAFETPVTARRSREGQESPAPPSV